MNPSREWNACQISRKLEPDDSNAEPSFFSFPKAELIPSFFFHMHRSKIPSISLRTQTVFEVKAHSASSCTLSRGESSGRDLVGIIVGVETMTNIARLSFFSF